MARILGIDYGSKRTGIAVTDPLQIIATALTTVETKDLLAFVQQYCQTEEVEAIVVGEPTHKDGTPTQIEPAIQQFIKALLKVVPHLAVHRQDEAYSSADARAAILFSGVKKMKRRDKSLVDKVSAVIILQQFMEEQRY